MPHSESHTAAQLCHIPHPVPSHNPAQEPAACYRKVRCCGISSSSSSRTRPWGASGAFRVAYLLLLAALLVPQVQARKRALQAAAQPCIECTQCLTAACQRICSPSCRGGRAGGVTIAMNGDQCRLRGEEAADSVADDACKSVQSMCQAGTKSAQQWAFQSSGVSSSVCAAIANGACSQAAASSQNTPCGVYLYFGFRSCSGRQFSDMYKSRVLGLCRSATSGY